jgi:hypothetical protein
VAAQLRGVLAAMQSAEVAREDEHDAPLAPEIAEAPKRSARIGQRERRKSLAIHERDSREAGGAGYDAGSGATGGSPGAAGARSSGAWTHLRGFASCAPQLMPHQSQRRLAPKRCPQAVGLSVPATVGVRDRPDRSAALTGPPRAGTPKRIAPVAE